jgi:hypothetical protein
MAKTKIHYGCKGSCGGEVTEEEFLAGQTTCADESCDEYGQPLEKMKYCSSCDEYYTSDSTEEHADCVPEK